MTEATAPSLALVIVSYNSASYLAVCLESLLIEVAAYPPNDPKVKTVVIENGTDLSSQTIVETYAKTNPALEWLRAPANFGYAGGANFGWQSLGAADFYIVLNPDMRFCPGWLTAILKPFEREPQIGIVGCKLLDVEGKIQHAGGLVQHGTALGLHFGAGEADDGRWDEGAAVEFVTGAALAIRGEVWAQVGGFDPAFWPGYYEDVDLCARVRGAGYLVWYEPQAVAYHYEGGTFGRGVGYYRAFHRNRLRFVLKNLATRSLLYDFVPAERARLRGMLTSADRQASAAVYQATRANPVGEQEKTLKEVAKAYNAGQAFENVQIERLEQQLVEVKKGWKVQEKPFRSALPFVATLREKFNSISTKWYVRPLLQQQVDYNGAVARALETLGQLSGGRDAASDMQYTVLAARLTTLEERLERIEALLERIVNK